MTRSLAVVLLLACCLRANFAVRLWWEAPYDVHSIDEVFLPYEALASWEGVTPRELGWPAATTRLLLSGVYAVDMIASQPSTFLTRHPDPIAIMDAEASWTRAQLADPSTLFAIGRWLSVIIGMLQVLAAYWSGTRWGTRTTGIAAALICAIAPLAVRYSQFVLADMTGVLCITALIGLMAPAANAPEPLWMFMGATLGIASATKYHFGMWLVPALIALALRGGRRLPARLAGLVAVAIAVHLLLVPWTWTNPLLIAKEFAGTVLSKVGEGAHGSRAALTHLVTATSGFGLLALVAFVPGIVATWRARKANCAPLIVGIAAGTLIVASAAEVYDRYGLLFFPAVSIVAAIGISSLLASTRPRMRASVACALVALTIAALAQTMRSQTFVGHDDAYAQANAWLMTHLKPGARVAIDSLYPQHLPRTREQLQRTLASVAAADAYTRKMAGNGFTPRSGAEPMREAVLNDELYAAHWARRELSGRSDADGFDVTLYDDAAHFDSVRTQDAIEEFERGESDPARGYDALLLRGRRLAGRRPDGVFAGGQEPPLYLYLRTTREATLR